MRVLLVDDDIELVASLIKSLNIFYEVDATSSGREAYLFASSNSYDCLVLDINLPDVGGMEVCRDIRRNNISTPIIMLTAETGLDYRVSSLNNGADDYLIKPFEVEELLARIKALIRRNETENACGILRVKDVIIDVNRKSAMRGGKKLNLREKEYEILEYLVMNRNKTLSKERIMNHIWGLDCESSMNVVEVHMCSLREKLDKGRRKKLIKTVYGRGYRIDE